MTQEEKIVEFYVLCNKLKDVIRTGWQDWNVDRVRLESVAEHVYGVQMLAIAMWSQYKYDIDIGKVALMLALHELEETIIGDLTQFQISHDEKIKIGHDAISHALRNLDCREGVQQLILEFDERKSPEAIFAYQCDKMECDIQCKLYDEQGCVDLNNQSNNRTINNKDVERLIKEEKTWSKMWLSFSKEKYPYDDNFRKVSDYVKNNNISKHSLGDGDGRKAN